MARKPANRYLVNVYYQSESGNPCNWRGTVIAEDSEKATDIAEKRARRTRKILKIDGGDCSLITERAS